jgi:hypothetical protein
MVVETVQNLMQIDDITNQIDEEKRKAIIFVFLGAIIFFVVVAGEVLGTMEEVADVSVII